MTTADRLDEIDITSPDLYREQRAPSQYHPNGAATLTSLERLPIGEGMIPTNLEASSSPTFHTCTPAPASPPQGLLEVPV